MDCYIIVETYLRIYIVSPLKCVFVTSPIHFISAFPQVTPF